MDCLCLQVLLCAHRREQLRSFSLSIDEGRPIILGGSCFFFSHVLSRHHAPAPPARLTDSAARASLGGRWPGGFVRTSVATWRGREPGRGRAFPFLRLRARPAVISRPPCRGVRVFPQARSSLASPARAQGRLRATAGCTRSSTMAID